MPVSAPIIGAVRGRGAQSNRSGRFEHDQREDFDDGWTEQDATPPRLDDSLTPLKSKTIITRNDSPDIGFDRSINPYVGCSHGCIYCFARPSHAYMGLSPGLDFETKLFFKPDAAQLLERALMKPNYQPAYIQLGANTDPYQPAERRAQVTRAILGVLSRFGHPVGITTKSALILRDLDILAPMAARGLVMVSMSVTTLDRKLARAMEPRASTPERRLDAVQALAAAGVPTAVMIAPIIPGITDHEIEPILTRAQAAGAIDAGYILLRLPLETEELFGNWLLENYPDKYRKVLALLRSTRDGKIYDSSWGKRMTGTGPYAWTLGRRFELACERLGLGKNKGKLRNDLFLRPQSGGVQLSLF